MTGNSYKGLNVGEKSKDPKADQQRVNVMRKAAMLMVGSFTSTRKYIDWITQYLDRLREAMAAAEAFQGEFGVVTYREAPLEESGS